MIVATSAPRVTSARTFGVFPSDAIVDRVIFRRRARPSAPYPFTLGEQLADRYEIDLGPNAGWHLAEQALGEAADVVELLEWAATSQVSPDPDLLPRVLGRMRREMRLAIELSMRMRDAWQTRCEDGFTAAEVMLEGEALP